MVDGKVSRLWAKKHHSEWYKEINPGEKPAQDDGNQRNTNPGTGGLRSIRPLTGQLYSLNLFIGAVHPPPLDFGPALIHLDPNLNQTGKNCPARR